MPKDPITQLAMLRKQIDDIDKEIIEAFVKRMAITKHIARLKRKNCIDILQHDRWNNIIRSRRSWAKQKKLSKKFITNLLHLIHEESLNIQLGVKNN